MLSSIINAITSIGDKIVSIPTLIVNGIKDLGNFLLDGLKSLFIPSDDYFSNKFNSLKDKVSLKLGFATYIEMFNSLKSFASGNISFGGFIDISIWTKYLPTLQNYIRGFMYALGLIFNIKMIIWMVRGSTPIEGGGRSN